jgi:hypothetical protein
MPEPHLPDPEQDPTPDDDGGEVSEVSALDAGDADTPIAPDDATAGAPDSESGGADEGTAGPDAPPRHGRPEPTNESSR